MPLGDQLRSHLVIAVHLLALNAKRQLDERRQRALTRYYLAAGAGGIAVGVHTTQLAIRDPKLWIAQANSGARFGGKPHSEITRGQLAAT